MNPLEKLNSILKFLKDTFIGKDEIIDLLGIALIAKENAFLLGPPGTAKSAIVRTLADCISEGKNFEYLLTRFTEPNELFGPFDIRKLREGELITNTEGMLPEASLVFLDEIFNANSAILNSLLTALNERLFRRGREARNLPALLFVGASNQLPEDEALSALLDRFLVRVLCDYVNPDELGAVLVAGRKLEKKNESKAKPSILPQEIIELQAQAFSIDLSNTQKTYINLIHTLRNTGIKVSDRRAVKVQSLIAASALISGRKEAITSDLWVLKYIWDTEEQIEVLAGIVDNIIEQEISSESHSQAFARKAPDAEEIVSEIESLRDKWNSENITFEEKNMIKDKLRYLQNRSNWIKNGQHKAHIQAQIDDFWQLILQTF